MSMVPPAQVAPEMAGLANYLRSLDVAASKLSAIMASLSSNLSNVQLPQNVSAAVLQDMVDLQSLQTALYPTAGYLQAYAQQAQDAADTLQSIAQTPPAPAPAPLPIPSPPAPIIPTPHPPHPVHHVPPSHNPPIQTPSMMSPAALIAGVAVVGAIGVGVWWLNRESVR